MRVAFVGSRMIPAKYGGLETFVEEISLRLKNKGFKIYVTCESGRFFEDEYKGIIRVHVPFLHTRRFTIPTIGNFLATLYLLLKHSRDIDIIYFVAPDDPFSALTAKLFRKRTIINADGIEWLRLKKRARFAEPFLKPLFMVARGYMYLMEFLSCLFADVIIADSLKIKEYLEHKHHAKKVTHIAYGARTLLPQRISKKTEQEMLQKLQLSPQEYYLTVARIVPENNIDMEIKGFMNSHSKRKMALVGDFNPRDPYTKYLFQIKQNNGNIMFLDPIYDKETLGIVRKNCYAYIHTYEIGGTNPSLLEQMRFAQPILSYEVPFNREVLQEGGIFIRDAHDLAKKIVQLENGEFDIDKLKKVQQRRIKEKYNWEQVSNRYIKLFQHLEGKKSAGESESICLGS